MKTIPEVDKEIELLTKEGESLGILNEGRLKKIGKKLSFLRMVRMYLEHNPKEEFIKSEIAMVEKRIDQVNEIVRAETANQKPQAMLKIKKQIHKEMEMKKLRGQYGTLNFILK